MSGLWDLLFPPRCPFCRRPAAEDGAICPDCQQSLPWLVGGRAERQVDLLEGCASALGYEGLVPGCVRRLKFSRKRGCLRALGPLAAQCAADHFPQPFDLISYPPLSPKALRRRGFDQAQLLARAVARSRGMAETALFSRKNASRRQSTLHDPAARRANVLGAFRLSEPEAARGKRILLVDDVVTTGATLSECARLLLQAGAAGVWGVTLTSAGGNRGRR